jgi:hypothetical protein
MLLPSRTRRAGELFNPRWRPFDEVVHRGRW